MSDRIHGNGEEKAIDSALHFDRARSEKAIEEIKRQATEHGLNLENVNWHQLLRDVLAYASEYLQGLRKIASADDAQPTLHDLEKAGVFGSRVAGQAEGHACSAGGHFKATIGAAVVNEVQLALLARFLWGELGSGDIRFRNNDRLTIIAARVVGGETNGFGLGAKLSPDMVERAAEAEVELLRAPAQLPLEVIEHLKKTSDGRALLDKLGVNVRSPTTPFNVRIPSSARPVPDAPT